MDKQITLSGFNPPDYMEALFLNSMTDSFKAAIVASGSHGELLSYRPTQGDSNANGYTAVYFHTLTAFRLKMRGKQHYISLPTSLANMVHYGFPVSRIKSDPKYIRILIDSEHPIESYADFLISVISETVNRYPKEWDCCSRYMECSDAKTCVHPDKGFALECGYRKILNSGRIFYGKNRNID